MNGIFLFLVVFGCTVGLLSGNLEPMMSLVLEGAGGAVELVIGLAGVFCLWGGIQRLAEESGLMDSLGRVTKPVLGLIFPQLKNYEKALGSVSATIVSNVLGLSSATPLGLKAMADIKHIFGETDPGIKAMISLVVINAAGFCIFPSSVIALRAALGSPAPAIVAGPTAVAGLTATLGGLLSHTLFCQLFKGD